MARASQACCGVEGVGVEWWAVGCWVWCGGGGVGQARAFALSAFLAFLALLRLLSLGSWWPMLFGFRASSKFLLFLNFFISVVMVLSREVSFSVLGRSQQQGKTIIPIKQKVVQFSLEKEGVPGTGPGRLSPSQGWRKRGLGVPAAGGWLRRSSSGWYAGWGWGGMRRGRAGSGVGLTSQCGLQG